MGMSENGSSRGRVLLEMREGGFRMLRIEISGMQEFRQLAFSMR